MVFLWVSYGFYGFPMVLLWFPYGFPRFSYGFPMVFLCFYDHFPHVQRHQRTPRGDPQRRNVGPRHRGEWPTDRPP